MKKERSVTKAGIETGPIEADSVHDPWWRRRRSWGHRTQLQARPCGPASPAPPPRSRTSPSRGTLKPTRLRVRVSARYEQRHSPPVAGIPGARGRRNRPEGGQAAGALTIGLEEAELVGGEATGWRHGGERRWREGEKVDRNRDGVKGTELLPTLLGGDS